MYAISDCISLLSFGQHPQSDSTTARAWTKNVSVKRVRRQRLPAVGNYDFQRVFKPSIFALIMLMFQTCICNGSINGLRCGVFKGGREGKAAEMWRNPKICHTWLKFIILVFYTTFEIQQLQCWTHAAFVGNHGCYPLWHLQFDQHMPKWLILEVFFPAFRCTTCLCTWMLFATVRLGPVWSAPSSGVWASAVLLYPQNGPGRGEGLVDVHWHMHPIRNCTTFAEWQESRFELDRGLALFHLFTLLLYFDWTRIRREDREEGPVVRCR